MDEFHGSKKAALFKQLVVTRLKYQDVASKEAFCDVMLKWFWSSFHGITKSENFCMPRLCSVTLVHCVHRLFFISHKKLCAYWKGQQTNSYSNSFAVIMHVLSKEVYSWCFFSEYAIAPFRLCVCDSPLNGGQRQICATIIPHPSILTKPKGDVELFRCQLVQQCQKGNLWIGLGPILIQNFPF